MALTVRALLKVEGRGDSQSASRAPRHGEEAPPPKEGGVETEGRPIQFVAGSVGCRLLTQVALPTAQSHGFAGLPSSSIPYFRS